MVCLCSEKISLNPGRWYWRTGCAYALQNAGRTRYRGKYGERYSVQSMQARDALDCGARLTEMRAGGLVLECTESSLLMLCCCAIRALWSSYFAIQSTSRCLYFSKYKWRVSGIALFVYTKQGRCFSVGIAPLAPFIAAVVSYRSTWPPCLNITRFLHTVTYPLLTMAEDQKRLQVLTEEYQKIQDGRHAVWLAIALSKGLSQTSKLLSPHVSNSSLSIKKIKLYRKNSRCWRLISISTSWSAPSY